MPASVESSTNPRYRVTDPLEIRLIIRRLIAARALLTLHDADGTVVLLSSILAIDEVTGLLILDTSTDEAANQRLLAHAAVNCQGNLDRIDVRFSLERLSFCTHQYLPAFAAALPKLLIYLQRREFYRLPAPLSDELVCSLTFSSEDRQPAIILGAIVIDLSERGLSIRLPAGEEARFSTGLILDHARLKLPTGVVEGPLLVRHVGQYAGGRGATLSHAGCEWGDLPVSMQGIVQRYMIRTERTRNARERGLI